MSSELLGKLSEPFAPKYISFLPGQTTKEKTRCMALAYADLRAYQNRLDEVCGLEWAVSYTPWGDKIICNLTISGVTRSSTGEPDSQSEKSEIDGTVAEAQAFKRACAMFGLGRYLYSLDSAWVEFDPQRQRLTDAAIKELEARYTKYYNAWAAKNKPAPQNGKPPEDVQQLADSVGATVTAKPNGQGSTLIQQLEALGAELYKEQWPSVRAHNTAKFGEGKGVADLTADEINKFINGLKKLKADRAAQPA